MKCLISNFLVRFLSRLLNCVLNCVPAPQLQIKGAMGIFACFLFCGFFAPAPNLAGGSPAVSAAARAESPSSPCRKAIKRGIIRSKLFNPDGSIKQEYIGQMEGYPLFADRYFNGQMRGTFVNVSAALSSQEMRRLGWRQFRGTTEKFRQLRGKLFNPDGSIKRRYIGQMEGYPLFADEYFDGKMLKTFLNVSAVLSKQEMELLGWQIYLGSTEKFRQLRGKLFNPDGSIKQQYIGQMKGYPLFADEHFDGKMQRTFINVSALLSRQEMNQLGWQKFQGTTEDFRRLRGKLFNPDGSIKRQYIGQMKGYPLFADEYFDGKMQQIFINVSAVLSKQEMELLGWQQFQGSTEEFRQLRGKLFNPDGSIKRQYIGQAEGYLLFADEHFDGEMRRTFQNVSAVASKQEMERLGWKQFHGSTEEFRQLRGKLFNPDGSIKRQYIGQMKGYPLFADEYFDGKMNKPFQNVSAVLSKQEMELLGWQMYQGSTEEFRQLRGKLFNPDGSIKRQYIGQEGQALFADRYFDGKMQRTFVNVSAVTSKQEMKQMGWRQFLRTAEEFRQLRGKLFNPDGSIKQQYIGQTKGYPQFADKYFDGQMQQTFLNVSAVSTREEMKQLGWQMYRGSTEEFRQLRGKLFNPDGSIKRQYIGQAEGYLLFAERYFEGRLHKTFLNVSAVSTREEMELLGWKGFTGTVKQFQALELDFLKRYPKGWIGLDGQKRVADAIFKGNEYKVYRNVSILRKYFFGGDGAGFRELGWLRRE